MPSYRCTAEQCANQAAEPKIKAAFEQLSGWTESASGRTNRMARLSRTEHYWQLARECLQIAQTFPLATAAIPFWTWRESGGVWPISKSTRPICEGIGSFSWRLRAARTGSGQNRRLRARVIAGRPGKRARRAAAWGTGGQNDGQA